MDSRRPHTQGTSNTEILKGVDYPNKFHRNKGKYQLDIIQFGNSLKSKSNFERSLLKSKSQSDLKST